MENIVVGILISLLSVSTIFGSVLVIAAFIKNKCLHKINNYFVLSLALADLIVGFVSMPCYGLYSFLGYWPFGHLACDLWLFLDYGICFTSVANLLVISFDRFFSTTEPITYRIQRTSKKAITMIILAWLVPIAIWGPFIFIGQYFVKYRDGQTCQVLVFSFPIITTITICITMCVPMCIMVVLNYKIYKVIRQRKLLHSVVHDDSKAAKVLSSILLLFVLTLSPFSVLTIVVSCCGGCVSSTVYTAGRFLQRLFVVVV